MALLQTNQSVTGSGISVSATFTFPVTAGNTIVVVQSSVGSAASNASTFDTQGNIYSLLVPFRTFNDGVTFTCQRITTCSPSTGTNTVTANFVGGSTPSIVIMEWGGPLLFDSSGFGQGELDTTVGGSFGVTAFTTVHASTILITAEASRGTVGSPGTGYALVIGPPAGGTLAVEQGTKSVVGNYAPAFNYDAVAGSGVTTSPWLIQTVALFTPVAQTIVLSGISATQPVGLTSVQAPATIGVSGIGSSETFGTALVSAPIVLSLTGIPSSELTGIIATGNLFPDIAFIQSNNSSGTLQCSLPGLTTVGNFIVVCVLANHAWADTSVSDSINSYTLAINVDDTVNVKTAAIFYAPVLAASIPTVTVSRTGTGSAAISIYEFSGIYNISPRDMPSAGSALGSSGNAISSTAMGFTRFPEDLIIGCCVSSSAIISTESGWTSMIWVTGNIAASEFLITSSANAYAATFTQSGSVAYAAAVASFRKLSAIGPAPIGRVL